MENKISVQAQLDITHYKVEISNTRHTIIADEPEAVGGGDTGPSPDELVAMALSACTSITLRMYAERKGWELGKINVSTTMMRDEVGNQTFERTINFENTPDAATQERLLIVANKCPVHKTLSRGNAINSSII